VKQRDGAIMSEISHMTAEQEQAEIEAEIAETTKYAHALQEAERRAALSNTSIELTFISVHVVLETSRRLCAQGVERRKKSMKQYERTFDNGSRRDSRLYD
jgi:hypothetical protein